MDEELIIIGAFTSVPLLNVEKIMYMEILPLGFALFPRMPLVNFRMTGETVRLVKNGVLFIILRLPLRLVDHSEWRERNPGTNQGDCNMLFG